MKILVASCDRNADTWEAFHHCMEKYWKRHPEVIYKTETVPNPYYRTIAIDRPLEQWADGMIEAIDQVGDDKILLMMDDCFIRRPVDTDRVDYCVEHLGGNVGMFNMERSFDRQDKTCEFEGFVRRQHGAQYEVSIMCGIWQAEALKTVLRGCTTPWSVEEAQQNGGYDFYTNEWDDIIDFGYIRTWIPFGISRGKWCAEVVPFFEHEGIKIDYEKRGIVYAG